MRLWRCKETGIKQVSVPVWRTSWKHGSIHIDSTSEQIARKPVDILLETEPAGSRAEGKPAKAGAQHVRRGAGIAGVSPICGLWGSGTSVLTLARQFKLSTQYYTSCNPPQQTRSKALRDPRNGHYDAMLPAGQVPRRPPKRAAHIAVHTRRKPCEASCCRGTSLAASNVREVARCPQPRTSPIRRLSPRRSREREIGPALAVARRGDDARNMAAVGPAIAV